MKATGKQGLITHTLTLAPEVSQTLERALTEIEAGQKTRGKDRNLHLTHAVALLEDLRAKFPDDPRLLRLLATTKTTLAPGDLGKDARKVSAAFRNLAQQARILQEAAHGPDRVSAVQGGVISGFDRKMMKAVVKLAEIPLAADNTPAATILSLDGKIISLGVNRAYNPVPDWRKHGEMEAMNALTQRVYRGAALVLLHYAEAGGTLDPDTSALLGRLNSQGLRDDPSFIDDKKTLRAGGFFAPAKIEAYSRALKAFAKEGGFLRDDSENGNLLQYHNQVLADAIAAGTIDKGDLANWATLEKSLGGGAAAKMDLYTSLEPCGMCMQNCTSQGHVGRIVYAAKDEAGGGISTMDGYAKVYFKLNRVPFELVGGLESRVAQQMYDHFFNDIYPKVKAGATLLR
ncbi:MAG: hypothetical protein U1E65_18020 [Myxococcota bacterium]